MMSAVVRQISRRPATPLSIVSPTRAVSAPMFAYPAATSATNDIATRSHVRPPRVTRPRENVTSDAAAHTAAVRPDRDNEVTSAAAITHTDAESQTPVLSKIEST